MTKRCLLLACVVACGAASHPKSSRDPGCFSYTVEGSDAAGTVVAVRERHVDACGGDPGVEPIVARLRVRPSGALERYDVVNNAWQPVAN